MFLMASSQEGLPKCLLHALLAMKTRNWTQIVQAIMKGTHNWTWTCNHWRRWGAGPAPVVAAAAAEAAAEAAVHK